MDRDDDFRAFVEGSWARLVRTALLLGSRPGDAEDLAQSALLRAYLAWDRVSRAGNVDAYVYRILVNTRATALRRRSALELPSEIPDIPTAGDPTAQVDLSDLLIHALRRLTPKHRAVLVLRYYADLSDVQVAEVLGVPVGTVKSRLHRAQNQLLEDRSLLEALERGAS